MKWLPGKYKDGNKKNKNPGGLFDFSSAQKTLSKNMGNWNISI